MGIDLKEWIDLKGFLANGHVIVTNGIDIEIAWANLRWDGEKRIWSSYFDKTLPNGAITHWKYI